MVSVTDCTKTSAHLNTMYKRIKIESSEKIKIKTKLHEIYVLDERISLTLTILSFDSERLRKLKAEQKAERE